MLSRPLRRSRALRRAIVLTVCTVLASTLGLVVLPARDVAEAAVRNPFNAVYQSNENGTITIVGNSQMSCPTGGTECAAARSGTASSATLNSNNGHTMTFLDTDNVTATTNSTSSELTLPAGSTVLHARLVWSGRQTAGSGGAASTGNIAQVGFRTPGQTAYTTLTAPADQVYAPAGLTTTDAGVYQAAVDITPQVRAAGTGTYWVGNIRAATGQDRYAGWSLVVAYRNPALPLRNLTVFQGFADVTTSSNANSTVDIPVSGFRTPASGTVNASVGFVAWEGDQGSTGDALRFNGSTLSDAARPANNYFTSRITDLGSTVTSRNPSYLNNLGVDMGTSNASGLLTNNQTSTTLQATTTGDFYYPGIITTAIDLYSPRFPEVTKSVVNLSGNSTTQAGDTLEYTLSFSNTGGDAASNAVVRDALPAGTTFVPGSLAVTAGAGTGPKTDAPGDDQGEFDAANRTVRLRVGTGATATAGGTIAPGATTTARFRVTVDRAAAGTTLDNTALLDYRAVTLGQDYTFTGNTVSTPVGQIADLAITSASAPPSQNAGGRVTYNLTVTNNGPNAAADTLVTDTLPAGTTFVSANPSTGTCGQSGGTVTCQLGTLAPGATVTIPVVVEVAPGAAAGTLVNRATVSSGTGDDVPGNNSTTASTTLTRAADLAATLTGPASAAAGQELTWTATLTNNGPSTATGASLTDLLPDGATFVRATASDGGTCTNANNQVSCTFGDLAPGATRTVTVVGRLDAGAPTGQVVNTATASSGTADPVAANNTATATTTVTQRAELSLTKTPSATSVVAGSRARFTVVVTNSGPSDASDVVLTDPAVAGYTVAAVNASQGTCTLTDGAVRCELGRIGPGASATVQVVGDVSSARAAGPLANTASVTTATPQGDTGNDSTTGTTQVTVSADVFLTKTASPNPVVAGQDLTYTLTVGNNGPSRATGVSISDRLPAGTTFRSSADCTADGQRVTCPVGALDVGQTVSRTVVVRTDPTLPAGGISNDATATATSPDPTPGNNRASYTSTTGASADLALTKTTSPSPVTTSPSPLVAGRPVTYTLRVTNAGPSAAQGVVVTDTAPTGVTFTAATASDGSACTVAAGRVSCALGSVGDDEVVTVEITGAVASTALGASSNTASVTAETPGDPTTSNNSSTSSTTVLTQADLGVVLSPPADPVAAGEVATYQLRITNAGPSVARNTIVTGQVPPGLIPVPGSSGGACEVIGETVRCALGTLPAGADTTVPLQARVPSDAPAGEVPGSAFIGSSATDTNPDNDESTSLLRVVTSADVSLAKDVTPDPLVAGASATYQLSLGNEGPSDATTLVLTDELPEGLTAQSVSSTLGTCSVDGQTVSCRVDRLAADAGATVTVQVLVDPAATGDLTNAATLTSATSDPRPGDTTASVTAPVVQAADLRLIKAVASDTVVAGGSTVYTLTVVNAGPSDADDLTVTDELPEGLTVLPGLAAGGADCSASTSTSISCTLPTLAAGDSETITFSALVDSSLADGTELANTATVTSPTPDQTPGTRSDDATTTVRTSADVSLVKGVLLTEPTAGEGERYQLTVTNNGPSDAAEVVVTDQLPEGTSLRTTTGAGDCSADGRTVTCDLGTLAPGEILTVVLDVDLAADLAGRTLTNSATVSTGTPDPDGDDDTADVTTVVGGRSDLGVSKSVTSGPVVAGGQVTYSLSVTNAGPSSTRDVRLVDTLPAGVGFVSATAAGGDCSPVRGTVVCTWPALAVGADPLTATVTVAVPASTVPGTTLTNTATATSANPDPTPVGATVDSTVGASADLSADKSLLEAPVAGEDVRWQVTVANGGPSDATGTTLVDTAPEGVTFTSAQTPRGTCEVTGEAVLCDLGTVASQDSFAVTLVGALAPDFAGEELSNTVTLDSDVDDADPADDSDTATSPVATAADLSVTKTADPATATAGSALTYTVAATNAGPSTARGVTLSDTLPAGFDATTAVLTDPALGGECTLDGPDVSCTIPSLADGATATVRITGTVTADLTAADLTNRASVQSDTEDPDRADDTTTLSTAVATSADLAVVQTAPPTVVAGAPISWDVQVTNDGPSDARGILVTEVTSDVVGSLRATINGQDCVVQGTTVSCPLGSLPAGETVTVTVTGVVDADTTATAVSATAAVRGSTTDPVPANNTSTTTTAVTTAADLQVTNRATSDGFTAGERVSWLVEVRNAGPSTARAVSLSDLLGPELTGVTATVDGVPCPVTAGEVLCDLGDLGAGATAVVTVSALLDPAFAGAGTTTTATATSATTDPVPADNTAPSTTDVVTSADLRVAKRLVGDATAGEAITFEVLATNDGPSQATGVVLTDTLPDEVTPTGATVDGGTCTVEGQVVTCALGGPLADGATAVATVTGTLDAGSSGELTNSAAVRADTEDPQPGSNTTSITLAPGRNARLSVLNDGPDAVVAGDEVEWVVTVTNRGPSVATAVRLTDLLPAGLTGVSATVDGEECDVTDGTVSCQLGDLASGTSVRVLVRATVPASSTGAAISTTATVTSGTPDADSTDDTSVARSVVGTSADVSVSIAADPATFTAGRPGSYLLTVRNTGPSDAQLVSLRDLLPTGLVLTGAPDVDQGSCTASGDQLDCALGTVPAGGTVTVRLPVELVSSSTATRLSTTATVGTATPDPASGNDTTTLSSPVGRAADLTLTKTGPASVTAGESLGWEVTVRNDGPSSAEGVVVTDQLPAGVGTVSALSTLGTCVQDGDTVRCELGALAPGTEATISLAVVGGLPADYAADTITNRATATSPTDDSGSDDGSPDGRSDSVTTDVLARADVNVSKQAVGGAFTAGGEVSWTITVSNAGPSTARAVRLTDVAPDGVTGLTLTGPAGVECDGLVCQLGDLAPGRDAAVEITATGQLPADVTAESLANQAVVTTATTDTNPGDNEVTSSTTVLTAAGVSVTKDTEDTTVVAGEEITWTLTVANAGPSVARDVVLVDPLTEGLTDVSVEAPEAVDCSTDDGVSCTVGTLGAGDSVEIAVTATVDPGSTGTEVANTASVTSSTPDADQDDNADSSTSTVTTEADLAVTKTGPDTGTPGETIRWTLGVANDGPSTARAVQLTDAVPASVTGVQVETEGSDCTVTGNLVSCAVGDLAAGAAPFGVTLVGTVSPEATGTVSNTATVTSATPEGDAADNSDTQVTTLTGSADVSVTKTADPVVPVAGQPATFTLTVANDGPSTARQVTLTDAVDPALVLTGVSGPAEACSTVEGLVSCALGDLPADGTPVVVAVSVDVPADYAGATFSNTATVGSTTPDRDEADNSAAVAGPVATSADLSLVKTVAPGTLSPGEPATFTLTVDNAGPSVARGVRVTDPVDPALDVTAVSGAECLTGDTGVVSCDLGDVAPDAPPVVITISVDVPADYATDTFANSATVTSTTTDPRTGDNTGTVSGPAAPLADLSVTTTPVSGAAVPGTRATWEVVVTNDGPALARGVTLQQLLPAGVSLVSATGDDVECDTATGTCTLGDLEPGGTRTLTVVAAVDEDYQAPTVTSTVSVTSTTPDPVPADNLATSTLGSAASADLSVVKTVDPEVLSPGEPATFTLTVDNAGPSTARDVRVVDPVDPDLEITGTDVTGADADCAVSDAGVVSCDLGDLAPDAEPVRVTIDVDVPADHATDSFSNSAVVSATTRDPDNGDNTGTVSGDAAPRADLTVTNTPVSGAAVPGRQVTWTVVVTNTGPALARGTTLTDLVPAGVSLVSLSGTGTTCDVATGSCATGDLAPGDTRTVTVVAAVDADYDQPTVTSTASVAATTLDPDDTDNVATSTLAVVGSADLSLVKTVDPGTLVPGEPATFTLTVENDGPSVARDVVVTDPVDPALQVTRVDGADCEVSDTGEVGCELGDLAPGADPVVITIDVDVPADYAPTTFTNAATVSSPVTEDPDPSDDTGSVTGDAAAQADLSVTTTPVSEVAVPGTEVTWELVVRNDGPALARGTTLSEVLPAGTTLVSLTGTGATCDLATGVCTLGDLAPGASRTLTVVAAVPADYASPTVTSTATVGSTTEDPDPTDDVSVSALAVSRQADLAVDITPTTTEVVPGTDASWTVVVRNDGPSVARGVTVRDIVPAGATLVSLTGDGVTCDTTTGLCTVGDLAPGDTRTLTVVAAVDPGYDAPTLTSTATVDASTPDPDDTDDLDASTLPVRPLADVSLVKTVDPGTLSPGEPATFTLTVANDGPSVARQVTVTDPVDPALTVTGVDGADCEVGDTGVVSCDLGDLAPGAEPVVITIEVDVPPGYAADTFANNAVVSSPTEDLDTGDNTGTVSGPAAPLADLSVTDTPVSGTATPGTEVTWEVVVRNDGPATARAVTLSKALPAGVTLVSITGAGADCDLAAGTCSLGDLAPGQSVTLTVVAAVADDYDQPTVTSTAGVASATTDPDTVDNIAISTLGAAGSADLSLVKTVDPGTLSPGEPATFTLTVDNTGPSVARDVRVLDPVDPALEVTDVTGPGCEVDDTGTVSCELGDLAPDADPVVITVDVDVPPGYVAGTFANSAVVSSATPDPDGEDNTGTVSGPAAPRADVSVTTTPVSDVAVAGGQVSWTVVVTNDGPALARGVTVSEALPAGVGLVSLTGDGVVCDAATGLCTVGDLAPGASRTITVVAEVGPGYQEPTVTSTASVASAGVDPDDSDNVSSSTLLVVGAADLSLVKTVDPGTLSPGEPATFTLTVANDGPSVAREVTVTDPVDPDLQVTAVDGADCEVSEGGVVTCDVGDIAPDADPVVITIDVDVPADYRPATFTNSATAVSAATADPDRGDNTGTVSGDAAAQADLSVRTTPVTATAVPGSEVSWQVVISNAGPATAREVTLSELLPEGVTLVSLTGDGVVCDVDTGVCTLGDLAPGATRTLTVVADVDAGYQSPTVTSTVSVSSTTSDPVPADDTDSSTLDSAPSADVSLVKTVDPGTLSPGEPATFTLSVDNTGPSVARDVTVTDPVDPDLRVTAVDGADCEIGGTGTVSCDLGDLAPDADPVVITVDVDVPAGYPADAFANTALVTATTPDPDQEDNTGSVSGPAAPQADLSVTQTPVTGAAVPGSQVSWTVVVRNDGPATARAATLSEVLPAGVTLVSLTGDDVTCDTTTGLCTPGDLAPGEQRTLTVVGTVSAGYDQPTLTATAAAAAATADPDDTDNVASSTVPVSASADLSLVKAVEPGTLSPGEPATFTLTVDNAGPSLARDVTVSDPVDPALTVTAVTGADCELAQTVTCDLGDLAPDADPVVITVDVDVPADFEPAEFANSATVTATTPDPSVGNDTGTVSGPAAAQADLSVTNTPVLDETVPGTEVSWTVVVTNDGPALARAVTLTDVVPAGVTLVSLSGDGVGCDLATGVCTLGDLAPGDSRTITVVAAVAADYAPASLTSTAGVTSATPDPDASDDVAPSTLPVRPRADLVVSNTAAAAAAVPGTESTWTVVVRNDGPSLARGVTAQDVLPAGTTLVSLTGDGVSCDTATGRCTLGDLAPGEERALTVVAAVPADYDRPTVTSTAAVDATTVDPDPEDNVRSSVLPVTPQADLSLVKTVDPGTLSPGEPATFTLTVANDGPSVARDVRVSDPVDPALTVTGVDGADCEVGDTGVVSCDLGDLAPGADPVVITIEVDVPADYVADTFANNAVVSSPTEDLDTGDNTGTVSGPAAPLADLSVTNTPVSGTATPGTEVTWEVVVRNDGPATARAVTLTEALPAGVTLVSITGAECDLATGTCSLGDLAPGQSITLTVVAAVADDYDQQTVTSTAGVASATTDPDTVDNVASSTLGAAGSADLSLVKTVDPGTLSPGEPATFTLTVDNTGPSVARQVTVTDPVDPALTVTAVDGADCEVSESGVVTCDLGDLPADADPVVITVDVDVPADYAADTFANNAVVGSTTPDPATGDNTGTVSGPAAAQADLSVSNVPGPGPAVPGGQVSWTVVVTNDGPALARGATLTDLLPAGVTLVSLEGTGAVCDTATGVCSLGDLAPGKSRTITVVAAVDADFDEPTLTSTATVSASTPDPDRADNVASSTLVVTGAADLSLVKTVDPEVLSPGEPATFTLTVENDGPSIARDVRVTDEVDAALVVTGTDGADCTVTGGTVDCDLGDLAPGADPVVITVDVDVPETFQPATFSNSATVASTTPDPDAGDNTGTVSGDSVPRADLSVSTTPAIGTAVPGTEVSWQVVVSNAGPATAREVTLSELLPDGVTLVSLTGDGVVCDLDTGVCTLGELAPGETRTLTVVAAVDPGYDAPTVTSTATVAATTLDPEAGNDVSVSTLTTAASADVSLVKTVDPGTLFPGEPATFTLTVANDGPSVARDVTVTDPVDPDLQVTAVDGADCEIGETGTVSCDLGDLAPDADPVVITVDVDVPAGYAADAFANTAFASSTTPDPDQDDNTGGVSGPAAPSADVSVTQTPVSGAAVPGSQVSWTVVVRNDGPATARAVTLSEVLPDGVELVSLTGEGVVCDTATGLCTLGDLAPGEERTLTVVAAVPAGYDQPTLTATAGAAAATADPDQTDNVSSSTLPVTASADLSLVKTVDPGTLSPGEPATFTLTVDNTGPSVARDVRVVDPVDPALTVTAVTGADCVVAQTVTCDLGDLAPDDAPVVITVDVDVPADLDPETFANSATVSATTPDPSAGNNTGTVSGPTAPQADLSVTNDPVTEVAVPGTEVSWTVVVRNDGPAVARGVTLTDLLPAGVALISLSGEGLTCDVATGTCTVDQLAPGQSLTVTVVAAVPADHTAPTLTSTASVTGTTLDPDGTDNVASSTLPVVASADLALVKTVEPGTLSAGEPATFTLTVTNDGPSVARDVRVSDPVDPELTVTAVSGAECTTSEADLVDCALGDLAPGAAPVVITIVVDVPADYEPTTFTNTATVSSSTADADPADDAGTVSGDATARADLELTKTTVGPLTAGARGSWRLTVANQGPAVARDVSVTDQLPGGATPVATEGCTPVGSTVTCSVPELAPGASVTFTVTADLAGDLDGTLTNVATVGSTTTEAEPADNTASTTDPVGRVSDLQLSKTVDTEEARQGDVVTWTVVVTNDGPSDASAVEVRDDWPEGAQLLDGDADQGEFDPATGLWSVGTLADGASATLVLEARLTATGQVVNTASVSSDSVDPDPSGDVASAAVGVEPTEPPVDPTDPPVDPTDPPVDPTDPPVDPTDPPVDPTDPPVDPSDPPVDPTEPPGDPSDAPVAPTQPPADPSSPPVAPGQPADPADPRDPLATTGGPPVLLGLLGLVMVLAGAGSVANGLRRRR